MKIEPGSNVGGDSISFLTVASQPPRPSQVVEAVTCFCGTRFYRLAQPPEGEKQKWCRECLRRQALREEAKRNCRELPDRKRVRGTVAAQVREAFGPQGEAALRHAVRDQLRRTVH